MTVDLDEVREKGSRLSGGLNLIICRRLHLWIIISTAVHGEAPDEFCVHIGPLPIFFIQKTFDYLLYIRVRFKQSRKDQTLSKLTIVALSRWKVYPGRSFRIFCKLSWFHQRCFSAKLEKCLQHKAERKSAWHSVDFLYSAVRLMWYQGKRWPSGGQFRR